MLVLSLYWQIGEGFSPIRAALSLAPLSLGMVVGMVASFALVARLGRRLVHLGIAIAARGPARRSRSPPSLADYPSPWSMVPAVP